VASLIGGLRGQTGVVCTGSVRGTIAAALLCAGACFAQQWEIGGAAGYGWYRGVRVNGPGEQASAGIRNRFAAGVVVTEDLYEHISGELRYMYHDGDPYISLNGGTANMQGQSHSFTYEVLMHVHERDSRLRPFIAVGAGGKYYRTTGPEPNPQPAPRDATLVRANEWKLLVSVGGGVTYRLRDHVLLRADFRDYITPFPKKLFVPTGNATDRGLFQQFTPMVGISYAF
jgi:hypothetical protein